MRVPRWTHSLRSRIVVSYSLILILGGLSTSTIGIYVTGRALFQQARQQVLYGLSTAENIYANRLQEIRLTVELLATSGRLQTALAGAHPATLPAYLTAVQHEHRLDFLSVADSSGQPIARTSGSTSPSDALRFVAPVAQALQGHSAASTEVVPISILAGEDPQLAARAAIPVIPTPKARPATRKSLDSGMVMMAAAPVMDDTGQVIAVVYSGQLLNHPTTDLQATSEHWIVDKINATLSPALARPDRQRSAATIFQDDVRISTNVTTADGRRAIGTLGSREVYESVVGRGTPWIGRAFVVKDWYITAYEPIVNLGGERIGMLFAGLLERPYTAARDDVTLIFGGIALFCFILIVVVTYFLTRGLVHPVEEMVSVSQSIAAGDLNRRVHVRDQSELGLLSSSFNAMLDRIEQMKSELEQWAKTLEQKVEDRTQQLIKAQTQVARQQRLASVGQLAAGVAHEINNPLGGILTFASLVLEDLPPGSPHRGDLEEIVGQAVRCRKIVAGLLEFSRQTEAQMAPGDVNEVVSRTLALLEKQALFHDINVIRKFDPGMPVIVIGESQMQQVFMNIILNAADAMSGRGDLTVETGHDDEKGHVFVRITDTGCGIPPGIRESIFDPFFTTKDPGKGTGLGLAVAARIVQTHGGRTEVESEVGRGTCLTVFLPLRLKPLREEETDAASQARSRPGSLF